MPPPPVAGAAVGNGLAAWVGSGDGDGEGEGLADGLAETLAEALALALAEALAVSLAVSLAPGLGVPEIVSPGENEGPAEGVDELEQAETVAKASRVMVP